jgi:hypothetical protein
MATTYTARFVMDQLVALVQSGSREPWNKVELVRQKAPLRLKEIWTIRIRPQLAERTRELALFNLAVDSKHSQFTEWVLKQQ